MNTVVNLADAILETLKSQGIDISNTHEVKNKCVILLNGLIGKKEYTRITRTNGAREYVVNTPDYLLIEEMKNKCGRAYLDNNDLFPAYADHVADYAIRSLQQKNVFDSDGKSVYDNINSLNINDRLKADLIESFELGDYERLRGFINDDIINNIEMQQEQPKYGSK